MLLLISCLVPYDIHFGMLQKHPCAVHCQPDFQVTPQGLNHQLPLTGRSLHAKSRVSRRILRIYVVQITPDFLPEIGTLGYSGEIYYRCVSF